MLITSLIVATLAVARLTRLACTDAITTFIRQWIVRKWGGDSWQSKLIHCPWCSSFWIGLLVMPEAVLFPNKWVIAALAPWAAAYVAGWLVSRDGD